MNITAFPCFEHITWRPNSKELRRFAIAMLIGFTVLGLLVAWRTKDIGTGSIVLCVVGVLLAIAAFVPKLDRVAYLGVYLPTSIIGYVLSHLILGLIFFFVITPLALLLRWKDKDLLQQRRPENAAWSPVKAVKTEDSYYRQF